MVKLTLYGNKNSIDTQKVLILLEELDLKYESQNKRAENNPFNKDVLVEYDERILYEPRTILKYISKANKDIQQLYGDIMIDMWLETENNSYSKYAEEIINNFENNNFENTKKKKDLIEKFEEVLDIYEKVLSEREYIASNNYTIADIVHIPCAYLLMKNGLKDIFKKRTNVYNWLKRIMKREKVKEVYLRVNSN